VSRLQSLRAGACGREGLPAQAFARAHLENEPRPGGHQSPARATTEQYELFARYQQSRHAAATWR